MYEYKARLIRAIDGDTVELDIDLGLFTHRVEKCRLIGIDTPEMREPGGYSAKARVEDLCTNRDLIVKTYKDRDGKYGRLLVEIFTREPFVHVNRQLVEEGHAQAI